MKTIESATPQLSIEQIFHEIKGLKTDFMLRQHTRDELKKAVLFASGIGEGPEYYDYHNTLITRRNFRVALLSEDLGRDEEYIYGIFIPEGEMIPDVYGCARLTGRRDKVYKAFNLLLTQFGGVRDVEIPLGSDYIGIWAEQNLRPFQKAIRKHQQFVEQFAQWRRQEESKLAI